MFPLKDDIPTEKPPIITIALIVINVLIFFYQISLGPDFQYFIVKLGAIPYEITHQSEITPEAPFPVNMTLLTSMFLHGGWLHIIGNMLYLWIFGNNIEDKLGHFKFIIFYLVSGIIASLVFVLSSPNSTVPMVGASGAIAGVLGAYLLKFPHARILTLIFLGFFVRIVRIPAVYVLGFWFVIQLIYALPSIGSNTGGVAWFAHIGGFVAGMGLFKVMSVFQRV
ncbi:MAG: Rhomboid family protein [candidate division Zixibacteria bacterium RBG-1]|nr:MAG: Rhomboid family protein [candidate division Zixibacteria bacterium RBG-1]OGC83446.1 MAG: rhomboid family intramembrane serine protease [candidate division Zixibacteria bacterium RBG_19FT_COMBO_42_43]